MRKRKITDEIIVHCTATPEGREVSVDELRRWHKKAGYSDVGYHYIVHLDGKVSVGRQEDLAGAHTINHNYRSVGVVYVGGLDKQMKPKDTRTEAQKATLLRLLKQLKAKYPKAKIYGHRNFANKACPCFDAEGEYRGI